MNTMNGQRRVIMDTSPDSLIPHQQKSSTSIHAHLNQTSYSNNNGQSNGPSQMNLSSLSAKPSTSRQQSGTTVTLKSGG